MYQLPLNLKFGTLMKEIDNSGTKCNEFYEALANLDQKEVTAFFKEKNERKTKDN